MNFIQAVLTAIRLFVRSYHVDTKKPSDLLFSFTRQLHSLTTLKMANGLADTVKILPFEPLKALIELQYLDLSNNKLKNVPDTSFHFLYKLRSLNLQDNAIEYFSKGTLQVHTILYHNMRCVINCLNNIDKSFAFHVE